MRFFQIEREKGKIFAKKIGVKYWNIIFFYSDTIYSFKNKKVIE